MQRLAINFTSNFTGTFILIDDENNTRRKGNFEVSPSSKVNYHIWVQFEDEIKLEIWTKINLLNPKYVQSDIVHYLEVRLGVIAPVV